MMAVTNPLKLLVTLNPDGTYTEAYVPLTDAEYAQEQADAAAAAAAAQAAATAGTNSDTIKTELQTAIATALNLADLIDAGTATAAQRSQAISLCLHGIVRLVKVVYRTYDAPA